MSAPPPRLHSIRPLVRLGGSGSIRSAARALFHRPQDALSGRRESLVDFLGQVSLFEDLAHRDLVRLALIVHERDFRDGEYICEEGRPGAALFVLRRGAVDIVRRSSGHELSLAMLEPPASFEETAAVGADTVHSFSVRARGPVSLLALGKSDLDALSLNFPLIANKVLMRLARIMAIRLQTLLDPLNLEESGERREVDS